MRMDLALQQQHPQVALPILRKANEGVQHQHSNPLQQMESRTSARHTTRVGFIREQQMPARCARVRILWHVFDWRIVTRAAPDAQRECASQDTVCPSSIDAFILPCLSSCAHQVALSRKGDTMTAYLDGKSIGSQSNWANIWIRNSGSGTAIGASWLRGSRTGDGTYPHHQWQGFLDQVCTHMNARPLLLMRQHLCLACARNRAARDRRLDGRACLMCAPRVCLPRVARACVRARASPSPY